MDKFDLWNTSPILSSSSISKSSSSIGGTFYSAQKHSKSCWSFLYELSERHFNNLTKTWNYGFTICVEPMWISKTNHMNGIKTKSTASTLTNSDETTFILAQLLRVHLPHQTFPKINFRTKLSKRSIYIFVLFYILCSLILNLQTYHLSWWLLK